MQGLGLGFTPRLLAPGREAGGGIGAADRGGSVVEIDERAREEIGGGAADRALAGTAEADQDKVHDEGKFEPCRERRLDPGLEVGLRWWSAACDRGSGGG